MARAISHFSNPEALAKTAHKARQHYIEIGYKKEACAIGYYGNLLRLACDHGCIDYVFQEDGQIQTRHVDQYDKLASFVDTDIAHLIGEHNQTIRDRALLAKA